MKRFVKASAFRTRCLALIKEVERTGGRLAIMKNGRPVVELAPHRRRRRNLFGILKGRLFVTGDIISPIDVEWNSLK
jgi:antitoxin (DNA-binding transcriptional repressor) of toxin-antitoxin stability system